MGFILLSFLTVPGEKASLLRPKCLILMSILFALQLEQDGKNKRYNHILDENRFLMEEYRAFITVLAPLIEDKNVKNKPDGYLLKSSQKESLTDAIGRFFAESAFKESLEV